MAEPAERRWECGNCESRIDRHHAARERPFCDECESRHGVLIEMRPIGPGSHLFFDDNGNAVNP